MANPKRRKSQECASSPIPKGLKALGARGSPRNDAADGKPPEPRRDEGMAGGSRRRKRIRPLKGLGVRHTRSKPPRRMRPGAGFSLAPAGTGNKGGDRLPVNLKSGSDAAGAEAPCFPTACSSHACRHGPVKRGGLPNAAAGTAGARLTPLPTTRFQRDSTMSTHVA